jgi:Icc-related predicted phosphoesterase
MPPFGILDLVNNRNFRVGSKRLREAIDIIKPKVHIFGHIHESFGHQKLGNTHFFNVAMLNEENNMRENPILIEF